ncbi:MAG: DUF1080 domain-containing protein [Planctomycetota bacterium]|nr:DUF1080 domain-containing protein [Planctomycetota bacterium]MDA1252108.1 DUF1080 domain-containing protein [Planctomycetota bacterium]
MRPTIRLLSCSALAMIFLSSLAAPVSAWQKDPEAPVILPRQGTTQQLRVFNGKDLSGWAGHEKYWSVEDGEIVGRNTEPVPVSTYLISRRDFSDFRLTLEFKLAESEMHSGVAFWGALAPDKGDEFTYAGHLVMFPSNYGYYDLYGRNLIHDNADRAKKFGKQHDWNRVEILAQGNRIRFALNGELISDWRDPEPDRIKEGPIGLQLHSNKAPQEIRFRSLKLETFPVDRLVTLTVPEEQGPRGVQKLNLTVDPDTPNLWTSLTEVVLPDEILEPIRRGGLKTMGIRDQERDSYFAMIQKAKETDKSLLHKASIELRDKRRLLPKNAAWKSRPPEQFPSFVDLYTNPDDYHGKLLTVHGHLRKLIEVPQDKNPYGIEKVYEAWLYDLNSQGHPTVILSTSIDPRLKTGTEVEIDHCFATGYFFKNMGYKAQDASRYAPVLIASQLQYLPSDEAGTSFRLGRNTQLQILLVLVIAIIVGRHSLKTWRQSKIDDGQREAVRELVDQQRADPTFQKLADDGGTPDFGEIAAADTSEPSPEETSPEDLKT